MTVPLDKGYTETPVPEGTRYSVQGNGIGTQAWRWLYFVGTIMVLMGLVVPFLLAVPLLIGAWVWMTDAARQVPQEFEIAGGALRLPAETKAEVSWKKLGISVLVGALLSLVFPLMIFLVPLATWLYLRRQGGGRRFSENGPVAAYALSDISEVLLRNEISQHEITQVSYTETHIWGGGMTGAAMNVAAQGMNLMNATGAAAGAGVRASLEANGYAVIARHGRHEVVLAQYLDEGQASALFADVTR